MKDTQPRRPPPSARAFAAQGHPVHAGSLVVQCNSCTSCNQKLTQMVKFKLLPVVTLEDHDIDNIAEAIRSCRAASYAAAAMTNLDRIDDAVAPSPPRHYLALVNDNYDGHVKRKPYASVEPADDP